MNSEKKKVFRIFFVWEYEKEEEWLNKMSAEGWQMKNDNSIKNFHYIFEKGEPNEYEYKLELLDESQGQQKNDDYIEFLKEADIEFVGKYRNWVYLRKKTSLGGFPKENKTLYHLGHSIRVEEIYQKVRNVFIIILSISFIGAFIVSQFSDSEITSFFDGFFVGFGMTGVAFLLIILPFMKNNIKNMKKYIQELYVNEGI